MTKVSCDATRLMVLLPSLALTVGCVAPRSYSLLNLETGQIALVRAESRYCERLLDTDDESRTFRTLARDHRDQFVVRTIDYNGRVLARSILPCFSDVYLKIYNLGVGFAVSPDLSRVAYLDESSRELRLFDNRTRACEVLLTNVAGSIWDARMLKWLSDKEFMVAVDVREAPVAEILFINVEDGSVVWRLEALDLWPPYFALSPSKRYLAYEDGRSRWSRVKDIRVLDLRQRKEIAVVRPVDDCGGTAWYGRDESKLLCLEGNPYRQRQRLMQYDLNDGTTIALKQFEEGYFVLLIGTAEKRVFYETGKVDPGAPMRCLMLDLDTRTETELKGFSAADRVFLADNGAVVIYEAY